MSNEKMCGQVLLKINSEIYNEKLIKVSGDFEIAFFSGKTFGKISLVPQINQGLIYIKYGAFECEDSKCKLINLGKSEPVICLEGENIVYVGVAYGIYDKIIYNEERITSIFNNIIEETNFSVQCSKAQKEIIELLNISRLDDNVISIIDECIKSNGRIKVSELAEIFDYSVRHFNRIFNDNLKISPKLYLKIIRCSIVINRMTDKPDGEITEYMENLGYFDQSHFQHEFKWFTGITPKNFQHMLADNNALFHG